MPERKDDQAFQLALFESSDPRRPQPTLASPQALTAESTLAEARWWYTRHLEAGGHPPNTVSSYAYDVKKLAEQVGDRPLRLVEADDIGSFLQATQKKATRKRRLTSLRDLYGYLIRDLKLLNHDPTERFYPERIHLKTPIPLFESEQERLLATALEDSPRSFLLVYCMLELGLNRTEVLNLSTRHVDVSAPDRPLVYVHYDDPRWRHKERTLRADRRFTDALKEHSSNSADDRLFPMPPPSVNGAANRLAKAAGLDRPVTPQNLRDTWAVERAREGMGEDELLAALGLASDPRNRDSVRRYIKLARPPAASTRAEREAGS
jgi:integrase/recombinase XerD